MIPTHTILTRWLRTQREFMLPSLRLADGKQCQQCSWLTTTKEEEGNDKRKAYKAREAVQSSVSGHSKRAEQAYQW